MRTVWTCSRLPRHIHQTLSLRDRGLLPGRVIIVGDVHGCNEQLGALLKQVEYARGVDNLVFVGDLVNKGPGNVQVLDTFLSCPGARAVRGNHDDAVLRRYYAWRDGREELKGQHEWIATLEERHVAALESLPFTLSLPDYGALVVHAGLVPGIELGQQDPWAMYKMRNVVGAKAGTAAFDTATSTGGSDGAGNPRDGALKTTAERGTGGAIGFTTAASREQQQQQQQQPLVPLEDIDGGGEAWAFVWGGPQHVFFGHDARRRLQLHPAATGLDTGCVYGGHLTAAVLPPLASLRPGGLPARLTVRGGGGVGGGDGDGGAGGRVVCREDLKVALVSVPGWVAAAGASL
ncbi:hypothetical protein FOA52_008641 [Chlamydomonas sp. UWO 241]|nr:hypothetical protein FOA52_008641 [Chlamydomonas sp. UWO 241]